MEGEELINAPNRALTLIIPASANDNSGEDSSNSFPIRPHPRPRRETTAVPSAQSGAFLPSGHVADINYEIFHGKIGSA